VKSPSTKSIIIFLITLLGIGIFTAFGPAERTLGANARVVYLHGAWVWAAMAAIFAAALTGLVGLASRDRRLHQWTYLPISMWAMQTNWNGLFLAEPRWRVAIVFALGGLLLQIGVTLVSDPALASGANILYLITLLAALFRTENVMHPPAPILNSSAWRIQLFFSWLLLLTIFAALQVARWWRQIEYTPDKTE